MKTEERPLRRVVLESPYAGDIERNVAYAKRCIRDSLGRGEAPLASHLLYTQEGILFDGDPDQRRVGIMAGLAWHEVADAVVVYIDYGISPGMKSAVAKARGALKRIEIRQIGTNDRPAPKKIALK